VPTQLIVAVFAAMFELHGYDGAPSPSSFKSGEPALCADHWQPQDPVYCKADLKTPLHGEFKRGNVIERYADGHLVRRETYSSDGRILDLWNAPR